MPDEPKPDEITPPEGTPPPEGEQKPDEPKGESVLSHEDALRELTRTRQEAANYRTKLREAEATLKTAKTPEEFEAARTELTATTAKLERDLIVERLARKHNLPDDLADDLREGAGGTEDELTKRAERLAKYADTEVAPAHLEGGLNPRNRSSEAAVDPRKVANTYGPRRKRS